MYVHPFLYNLRSGIRAILVSCKQFLARQRPAEQQVNPLPSLVSLTFASLVGLTFASLVGLTLASLVDLTLVVPYLAASHILVVEEACLVVLTLVILVCIAFPFVVVVCPLPSGNSYIKVLFYYY